MVTLHTLYMLCVLRCGMTRYDDYDMECYECYECYVCYICYDYFQCNLCIKIHQFKQ